MNKIIVQNDQARLYGRPYPIPQGQSQFSEIEFSFSEEWANLRKIAQFEQKNGPYNVDISDNKCFCPSELVKGWVNIRVKGYPEDTTSAVIATANEILLPVSMGFKPGGTPPVPPTPDLYQKLIGEFSDKVQSDWNQNDPTAKDYVRNRTHYVSRESVAVVPEQEVTTTEQQHFNIAILNNVDLDAYKKLFNSEDDTTFDVVFDGTSYPCKWLERDGNRIPALGDLALSNSDTGEPFCITPDANPDAGNTLAIGCKVAGTHTVAVSYQQDVVHKIDGKFLPDDIGAVQPDWGEQSEDAKGFIKNKPEPTVIYTGKLFCGVDPKTLTIQEAYDLALSKMPYLFAELNYEAEFTGSLYTRRSSQVVSIARYPVETKLGIGFAYVRMHNGTTGTASGVLAFEHISGEKFKS